MQRSSSLLGGEEVVRITRKLHPAREERGGQATGEFCNVPHFVTPNPVLGKAFKSILVTTTAEASPPAC